MKTLISFQNVSLCFDGETLVRDVTFTVSEGMKTILSGKSGTGKTSLVECVLGFVRPCRGRVSFRGRPVDESSVWDIRRQISYVNQDASIGSGRVRDCLDVCFAFKANRDTALDEERCGELLDYFELHPAVMKKRVSELSGGERQRVALVIALLLRRNIFILDEVTASLDTSLKKKVVDLFTGNPAWTVIVVSHDALWQEADDVSVYTMENNV